MTEQPDWRAGLAATDRYENILKLKKSAQQQGNLTAAEAQKIAFAAETDAYKFSTSREAYDEACSGISAPEHENRANAPVPRVETGQPIEIGKYSQCYYIARGIVSEVYKSDDLALKVITETQNVEPHDYRKEITMLRHLDHKGIIKLLRTENDSEGRPILIFPYRRYTLADLMESRTVIDTKSAFHNIFSALDYLHANDMIHRDIKPSNILMDSPSGPAYLADFGTAWSSAYSAEPRDNKQLEVGSSCYRAPETLFGNRGYTDKLDMWAAGTVFAQCLRQDYQPLFESRGAHEDGNQLGLILSIFKTIGTPTPSTWPEAVNFSTPPFQWYQRFEGQPWDVLVPDASPEARHLIECLVKYESGDRFTAEMALRSPYLKDA